MMTLDNYIVISLALLQQFCQDFPVTYYIIFLYMYSKGYHVSSVCAHACNISFQSYQISNDLSKWILYENFMLYYA